MDAIKIMKGKILQNWLNRFLDGSIQSNFVVVVKKIFTR